MKTICVRAVRALFNLCLAGFFALLGAVSPCFAAVGIGDYYWSTGSGNNHLWGHGQDGWWDVLYEVDRGGSENPNPEGHYEWTKQSYPSTAFEESKLFTHFSAFNQTVQPKVFSVSLVGNDVSPLSIEINNAKSVFYAGHDWTFSGDYSSRGSTNISASQILIKGGASNSRFTTTFDNVGVFTGTLHISDYNTLLVRNGSRLHATEVVLDSGVLDFRGSELVTGSITGKRDSSLNITAQGNSTTVSGIIFGTNVLFSGTYNASPGNDYSVTHLAMENSPITIGDDYHPSWVAFSDPGMLVGSPTLNIAQDSRLTIAGDKIFSTKDVALVGSGTLRLSGDLQNKNITNSAFTGTYDLNGHKLWLDATALGKPSAVKGGGELSIGLKNALTLGGSSGFFQAGASEDLMVSLNAVASGKLTIADTGTSTGGSLSLLSGEGEIILSGGAYNYQKSIYNQHSLTLSNRTALTVGTPYNLATNEGGLQNDGRLTIAGPATLHGDLAMPMDSFTTNSLVLEDRFTVDGNSLFINLTTLPGSPVFGRPIKTSFDYRGGKLITTGELALNDVLFQSDLMHHGFYVMAEYGTLTGAFGNAAQTISNVSSLVKLDGKTQTGQDSWLVYDDTHKRILLIAGDSQTILFRNDTHGSTWKNLESGWESLHITGSGITTSQTTWSNVHPSIAVFDKAYGTPGTVSTNGDVQADALIFMDNGWKIDGSGKVLLHPLPIGDEHPTVLNSQAPDDPTFAASPRIDAPMAVANTALPLYKTGAGTLILSKGFYDAGAIWTAPERVVIKDGRLVLENNLALASLGGYSGSYYSSVAIEPGATLRLNFPTSNHELFNPLSGSGNLEIASGSEVTSRTAQPEFYGTITVEAGNASATNTILYVAVHRDAFGSGGDIVLKENGTYSSTLLLNYDDPSAVFPRRITGEGVVVVENTASVRFAPGNTYTGGTTIRGTSELWLEGEGQGRAITATGTGGIVLDGSSAALRLTGGGILGNELSGNGTLSLDAQAYTLLDNTIRTDSTDFTGTAVVAVGGALTLRANVTQGTGAAPPFVLGGAGDVILDGDGVTFSALQAATTGRSGTTIVTGSTALRIANTDETLQIGTGGLRLSGADSLLHLDNLDFGNALSGIGKVSLTSGSHLLTGDNRNFAGNITIPGTLTVNAQSDVGMAQLALEGGTLTMNASLTNMVELLSGSSTLDVSSGTVALDGPITGSGNLSKNGTGTLILTSQNSDHTGTTTVAQGQLRLEDARLSGNGALTVQSGATLSGWGEILGNTTIQSGGTLSVDGLLSGTNLTLDSGGSLAFNHGGMLDVTGNMGWGLSGNATTINLDSLGVHVLAKYGTTSLANGIVTESNYTANYNGNQLYNDATHRLMLENFNQGGQLVLIAMPNGQKIEFWAKDSGGIWNTDGETNWSSTYSPSAATMETWSSASRAAVFGADGATPGEVRVQGPVSASGMFFLTDGWRISGGPVTLLDLDLADAASYAVVSSQSGDVVLESPLTGSAGLHKSGSGRLALTAANTYTGNTRVSAGTLELGRVDAAGLGTEIAIEDGATLLLAYRNTATGLRQELTGSGTVEIGGEVLLDRANPSFTGTTRIHEGFADLTNAGAFGTGTVRFDDGVLRIADGLTINNPIALRGRANLFTLEDGTSTTLSGTLTGSGSLIKSGQGTLTVNGDNSTFYGVTVAGAGTLVAGSDTAFGTDNLIRMEDGAVFGFSGNRTLKNSFALDGNAYFAVNSAAENSSLNGVIDGSGDLFKIGQGTLTLGGVNAFSGMARVLDGTLALGPQGGIAGNLALYNGATFNTGGNVPRLSRLEVYEQGHYTGDLDTRGGTMFFALPADVVPGQAPPMLLVSGDANIDGSLVGLSLDGRDRTTLKPGHTLTLVQSAGLLSGAPADSEISGRVGITRAWTAGLTQDDHNLYASVTDVRAAPESKALAEGFLAGLTLINRGADLVAGQGIREAARAAEKRDVSDDRDFAVFGVLSGDRSRYDSGSHVDMSSFSLVTGLSLGANLAPGRLTLGAFFEYGNGSYDTYNSFTTASIHGHGNAHYSGGGILGHMDFADTGPGRFYAEASARAGRLHNDYKNSDLRDAQGRRGDYDSSSTYYGAHAGAGYLWNITDKNVLDLYGNFFWTRQKGDTVTLPSDDSVSFKDADSRRLRGGVRLTHAVTEYVRPYIGLAYEHEFSGTVKSTTYGLPIDEPSVKGGTGIGEIGLSVTPSPNRPLAFDLGVQGYTGKREGVTGSLRVNFKF